MGFFAFSPVMAVSSCRLRSISRKIWRRSSGGSCAAPAASTKRRATAQKARFQPDAGMSFQDTMVTHIDCLKEQIVGRRKRSVQSRVSGQWDVRHQQAQAEERQDPCIADQEPPPRIPQIINPDYS